jgi:hypothetical protein
MEIKIAVILVKAVLFYFAMFYSLAAITAIITGLSKGSGRFTFKYAVWFWVAFYVVNLIY